MADDSLLAADIEARRRALDVSESFIVQAPAGSGKTELLIQRYLKLLALVDDPEEVIAITFTRKASAEMLKRVLAALKRATDSPDSLLPHERITHDAARAVLARDRERGWNLERHARRLRIQTLDSLNASIARMLPVSAAINVAGQGVGDKAETDALYREAAMSALEFLNGTGPYADSLETLLGHLDNNTRLYQTYVVDMLRTRDQWLPFIGSGRLSDTEFDELRDALEADLASIRREHIEAIEAHLSGEQIAALGALGQVAADNLEAEGNGDHPVCALGRDAGGVDWWCGAAELLLTKQGQPRKTVTKSVGLPPECKDEKRALGDLIEEIARRPGALAVLDKVRSLPPERYTDSQWRVLEALIRVLPLAVAELNALFARRGMTDYVEITRAADSALGTAEQPSDIALLLDYQVRHILVDEMQDTSLAQYAMIKALTRGWSPGDGRTLFCVGDPMQSIYRFRNAEVAQFLAARNEGIGDVPLTELVLRRNFRSGEHLVAWFNRVFPTVLPAEDDVINSAVSYSTSIAAEQHLGQGRIAVYPALGAGREIEADTGLAVIERLLEANPGDCVAVLVRSRTVLPELLERLRSRGIAYDAIDIDRLTDLPEIIEVLALTRAAVHPGDRLAWLAVLRAPWIGLDWSDLHALVVNEPDKSVRELLADETRVASLSKKGQAALQRAAPVLRVLAGARRFESLRDVVERVWLRLGGALVPEGSDAIDNVYRFFDVLSKLEQAGTLDDVAALEERLDEEHVATAGGATVSVMTMHKAKGLQFDHVVLYGLGRRPRSQGSDVLSWFELPPHAGEVRKVLSPVGPRGETEKDPIHQYIRGVTTSRDRFETGRLLYVACTRAIKSLNIIGHSKLNDDETEVRPPEASSLLRLLWPEIGSAWEDRLQETGAPAAQDEVVWAEPRLLRFSEAFEPPAVAPVHAPRGSEPASPVAVEFDWVGANARVAGTLVHRCLHRIATGRGTLEDFTSREGRTRMLRWLEESGLGADDRAEIVDRVLRSLETMAGDERGRWLLEGGGDAELSLTGLFDGQLVTGVIDRVRIDGSVHWVVDYKTSSHEGGNLPGFLAAEAERYREQLRRYRALYAAWSGATPRTALYFPLLGEWLEVEAS